MSDKEEPAMHFTPQEGYPRGGGDRRNNGGHHYTDAHWHRSKAVSITNLVGFLVLIIGGTRQ